MCSRAVHLWVCNCGVKHFILFLSCVKRKQPCNSNQSTRRQTAKPMATTRKAPRALAPDTPPGQWTTRVMRFNRKLCTQPGVLGAWRWLCTRVVVGLGAAGGHARHERDRSVRAPSRCSLGLAGIVVAPIRARYVIFKKGGNIFRVGVFLDFVRRSGTTRAPHGAHARAGSQMKSN